MNILGMPLHVGYYTVHDPVTGIVGWAPHTNSSKRSLSYSPVPTKRFLGISGAEDIDQSYIV